MFDEKKDKTEDLSDIPSPFRPAKGSAKVVIGNGVKINGEIIDADEVQIDGQADITVNSKPIAICVEATEYLATQR